MMTAKRKASIKLSEQQWYQNSSTNLNNISMYGSITMNDTTTTTTTPTSTISPHTTQPVATTTTTTTTASVAINVPDLLVLELHRDHVADVTYKHYTIRGLYKYVIDAISDKTGVLQAVAAAQLWHRNTFDEKKQQQQSQTGGSNNNNNNDLEDEPNNNNNNANNNIKDLLTGSSNDNEQEIFADDNDGNNGNDNDNNSNEDAEDTALDDVPQEQQGQDSQLEGTISPPLYQRNVKQIGINKGQNTRVTERNQQQQQKKLASNVTYRERLGGYLHPRDMRRLVTPFSTQNEPSIIVRRHVILINYDPLRTIILRDRILVLVPDGADSLLSKLEQRIRGTVNTTGNVHELENALFDSPPSSATDTASSLHNNNNKVVNKGTRVTFGTGINNATNQKSVSYQSSNISSTSDDRNVPTEDDANTAATAMTTMDEWNEMAAREWVNLPFELQCTDAVLYVVCSILQEEVVDLQVTATNFIERIINQHGNGLEDDPLTIIRAIKDAVQLKSNRVKSFVQSLHRLLDDDEDMALMNLSRLLTHPDRFVQPVPQRILNEESDEPELILEGHLQVALSLQNYCDVIQGQTHTAKELIDQRLDATRNKLLFANMLISVFTLCVTLGALIGSFFGMNLEIPPPIAESDVAFTLVVIYTCVGCLIICIIIMVLLLYTGTIPFRLTRRFRPVRISV